MQFIYQRQRREHLNSCGMRDVLIDSACASCHRFPVAVHLTLNLYE